MCMALSTFGARLLPTARRTWSRIDPVLLTFGSRAALAELRAIAAGAGAGASIVRPPPAW